MQRWLATLCLLLVAGSVMQGQQGSAKSRPRDLPLEVFQILDLPLNIHEAVLVEKDHGFLLRCRISNESTLEITGVRYSLAAIEPVSGAHLITNRTEALAIEGRGSKTLTFTTPIKFKPMEGSRLVLMFEQVLSAEAIWEVIKAKDALDAYVKGDYSIQPNVMRVANQMDAFPQIRVIH